MILFPSGDDTTIKLDIKAVRELCDRLFDPRLDCHSLIKVINFFYRCVMKPKFAYQSTSSRRAGNHFWYFLLEALVIWLASSIKIWMSLNQYLTVINVAYIMEIQKNIPQNYLFDL